MSLRDLTNGRDFRDGGQGLRIEAMPGNLLQRYMFMFTDPYFIPDPSMSGHDISLNISGFYYDRRYWDWYEQRLGGRASLGYRITDDLSLVLGVAYDLQNPRYANGGKVRSTNDACNPQVGINWALGEQTIIHAAAGCKSRFNIFLWLIFKKFKELASKKKEIYEVDIELLIEGLEGEKEKVYELLYNQAVSGEGIIPSATVKLRTPEGEKLGLAVGNGPVDATYKAIKNALSLGDEIQLKDFKIRALTAGTDALAEVFVTIESEGLRVSGRGVDPDIVRASALAFIEALNRLARRKNKTRGV
jgi:hypothetical protein